MKKKMKKELERVKHKPGKQIRSLSLICIIKRITDEF